MYHLSKNGISVELGAVMSGSNPEHVCNAHIFIEGFGHIRGIVIYKKVKDGAEEILLRMPGYRKSKTDKYETAYIVPDKDVCEVIFEAVRTIPKENYSRYYGGPKIWSIWNSSKSDERAAAAATDPHLEADEGHQ